MIKKDGTYVVMGLLDANSIAYAIGRAIQRAGGNVIYTIQNPILKKRYIDSDSALSADDKDAIDHRFCDVTKEGQIEELFSEFDVLDGVVHSLAYANPNTCLGEELHTDAIEDIKKSYEVSCASLATVTRYAAIRMKDGGAVVAMSFSSSRAFPVYNWMGVHKAALEALVRALARRHGRDRVRVNCVSAGPLKTTAAKKIPDFEALEKIWRDTSPIPWDSVADKKAVAEAVTFLLGPYSAKITGQVLYVDGGASAMGGPLFDYEK